MLEDVLRFALTDKKTPPRQESGPIIGSKHAAVSCGLAPSDIAARTREANLATLFT